MIDWTAYSKSSLAEMIEDREAQLTAQAAHIALLRSGIEAALELAENHHAAELEYGFKHVLAIEPDDAALREQNARLLDKAYMRICSEDRSIEFLRQIAEELRSGK